MKNKTLKIHEIFSSIMGEYNAFGQGVRATFVRLSGCNLKCTYCDTVITQDGKSGEFISIEEILKKVMSFPNSVICVTGGEPLIQENCRDLIEILHDAGYSVVLETNGTIDIYPIVNYCNVILDYKLEYPARMIESNHKYLYDDDAIKFVISNGYEFNLACEVIEQVRSNPVFVFSPNLSVISAKEIFNFIQKKQFKKELNILLSVQIHKLIDVQ